MVRDHRVSGFGARLRHLLDEDHLAAAPGRDFLECRLHRLQLRGRPDAYPHSARGPVAAERDPRPSACGIVPPDPRRRRKHRAYQRPVAVHDSKGTAGRQLHLQGGDHARNLYYLSNGQVLLPEIGKYLEEGDLFGEVGLFSDQQVRTTSAKCSKPCVMFTIGKDKIVELYHADSAFGYYLTKLIANRMHDNLTRSIADRARERAREEAIMARETNLRELGSARVETR
ncbi:cyclic nucleotide-binding domain-containing protein [Seohaeicola zhoushanensis]